MRCSSSILLIGAIAPLAIAKPVPHFRLPFRRSTGDIRPWDGAIERDWNGTLDLPSAEVPKKSTVETPPIVLHKTLDEAHPYFAFLRNLVKRKRSLHNVISLRTTNDIADAPDSPGTAKVPVPVPLPTPPAGTKSPPSPAQLNQEGFDSDVDTLERDVPAPISAPHQDEEKRPIQYARPNWLTGSDADGAPHAPDATYQSWSAAEADDEHAKREGSEANQMPPGHPVPETSPLAQDKEVNTIPLTATVKRDMMTLEELQRKIANVDVKNHQDAEEAKKLAAKMDILEKKHKERELKERSTSSAEQLRVRGETIISAQDIEEMEEMVAEVDRVEKQEKQQDTPETPQLTKRNNKFAGSDIVTAEEASQAWKQTLISSKDDKGKTELKGMETWIHESPFGKRDEEEEWSGDEHEIPGFPGQTSMLRFGKRSVDVNAEVGERDVAKPHLENQREQEAKVPVEAPKVEVVQSTAGAEATETLEELMEVPFAEDVSSPNTNTNTADNPTTPPKTSIKSTSTTSNLPKNKGKEVIVVTNGGPGYGYGPGPGAYGPSYYNSGGPIVPGPVLGSEIPGSLFSQY
ncbi:hypothetical protein FKW77_002841 [Venturia effusa]|uniref:Uncharacterized protein n=1 Tax=Venturia effusa TaxID=50376 RepID=A0A517LMF3_9PEZI|nr:hypothetical protein FKW77_002841 [Venturia effusa]